VTGAKPPPPGGRGGPKPWRVRLQLEIGTAQRVSGELEAALDTLVDAFAAAGQTDDGEMRIAAARELGLTLLAGSRLSEAEAVLNQVLDESATHYGEDSPQWASAAEELALARRARGDLQGALRLQRGAHQASVRSLGRTDPVALALGQNTKVAGKSNWPLLLLINFRESDPGAQWPRDLPDLFLRTSLSEPGWIGAKDGYFEVLSKLLREEQPDAPRADTYFVQSVLGRALTSVPGYEVTDEGFELSRRILDERTATLGPDHPQTLNALILLSRATGPRDIGEAVDLGREGTRLSEQILGRGHVDTLGAYENLAELLDKGGKREEAVRLRKENLVLRAADEGIIGDAQPPIENLAGTLTEPLTRSDPAVTMSAFGGTGIGNIVVGSDIRGLEKAEKAADEEVPEHADEQWMSDAEAAAAGDVKEAGPGGELVRRTAHVELDPAGPVRPGEHFDVGVYVDCAMPVGPGAGELVLNPPAGVTELTLRAWLVVSRHFEIEGDAILPLPLDLREPSSPKLVFRVRAAHAEKYGDEEPEVRVLFSYLGWPSGEVRLPVPLVQPASGAAP